MRIKYYVQKENVDRKHNTIKYQLTKRYINILNNHNK